MASRTASLATRLPRAILALALAATIALGLYAAKVPGQLELGGSPPAGSGSEQVFEALSEALDYEPQAAYVVLLSGTDPIASASSAVAIRALKGQIENLPGVAAVRESAPSDDGLATTLAVHTELDTETATIVALGQRLRDSLDPGALKLTVAGAAAVAEAARSAALQQAPARLALVLPLIVLLLAAALGWRGGLVALLGAALAATAAVGLLGALNRLLPIDAIASVVAGILGATVAIEISATLLRRYREEAATLGAGSEALRYALGIVLRGVAIASFSALLVAAALLVIAVGAAQSIGIAVLVAAFVAPLAALLTAAALIILRPDDRLGEPLPLVADGERASGGPPIFRGLLVLARGRSRGFVAIVPVLIVAALALPLRDDAEAIGLSGFELPDDQPAALAEAALAASFGAGAAGSIQLLTDARAEAPTVTIYRDEISRVAGIDSVSLAVNVGRRSSFAATTTAPAGSLAARQALERVAALAAPAPRQLGGPGAALADSADRIAIDLPLALIAVLLATAALWSLLLRSAVAPLLALSAAIAPLAGLASAVGVFGLGRFSGLLDYAPAGGLHLESYLVVGAVLLTIGLGRGAQFGAALREERNLGGGAAGSLARAGALTLTGVAAATAVAVVVAGAWVGADLVAAQEIGVGLAAGLIADLLLTRILLAPALARLAI